MAKSETSGTNADAQAGKTIQALAEIDITALSYATLRRLSAALIQTGEKLKLESDTRSENIVSGDTVRVPSPRFDPPR